MLDPPLVSAISDPGSPVDEAREVVRRARRVSVDMLVYSSEQVQ